MSINLEQFHQTFFEESFEGLDSMESGLLNLQAGGMDADTINTIFRAAHSIKGGSGTFGFSEVAKFTHVPMRPAAFSVSRKLNTSVKPARSGLATGSHFQMTS